MKALKILLMLLAVFVLGHAIALAQVPDTTTTSPFHPAIAVNALAFLKGSAVLLMVVVGMVWKFAPFSKNWSNDLIPWVNVVLYLLGSFAGVTQALASTGGGDAHNFATNVLLAFVHSGIACALWDNWLKPHIDKALGAAA